MHSSKCCFEGGAGIGQGEILAVIIDVAHIGQGKDRFAAVTFAAGDGGDRPGGGDGGLGGVADAVFQDAVRDAGPIDDRAVPVVDVIHQRGGRLPGEVVGVIDAALDGRESAAFVRQLDAGAHGMVADEFHDLRGELQAFVAAVADAGVVHQITQPHDTQADAAGVMRGF